MFGFFKKERLPTIEAKLAAVRTTEELISRLYGFPTLTEGRRTRTKFAICCTVIAVGHVLKSRNADVFVEQAIDTILKSTETQARIKISDVFHFNNGFKGEILDFSSGTFVGRSRVFETPNTWTNGRGALAEILDAYGGDAVDWLLARSEVLFHASSLLMRELNTGTPTGDSGVDMKIATALNTLIADSFGKG
jgi:hypothetical protein